MISIIRDIKGYEGLYTVDEFGNVMSVKRGKLISQHKFPNGYVYVNLHKRGKTKTARVHRVVAETFIPNPSECTQVNHKNGLKTDNRLTNLEWCDPRKNMRHAMENGLFDHRGESNPSSKLTVEDVEAIRSKYVRGSKECGTVALGREYNVSNVMIGKIVRNKNWKGPERSVNREE